MFRQIANPELLIVKQLRFVAVTGNALAPLSFAHLRILVS